MFILSDFYFYSNIKSKLKLDLLFKRFFISIDFSKYDYNFEQIL